MATRLQSIRINDNITVRIIRAGGNQVRLGIEAPMDVVVHREEVYERVAKQEARRA